VWIAPAAIGDPSVLPADFRLLVPRQKIFTDSRQSVRKRAECYRSAAMELGKMNRAVAGGAAFCTACILAAGGAIAHWRN
jgi:hypothetical protein